MDPVYGVLIGTSVLIASIFLLVYFTTKREDDDKHSSK